jgi:hypothetical protein
LLTTAVSLPAEKRPLSAVYIWNRRAGVDQPHTVSRSILHERTKDAKSRFRGFSGAGADKYDTSSDGQRCKVVSEVVGGHIFDDDSHTSAIGKLLYFCDEVLFPIIDRGVSGACGCAELSPAIPP